MHKKLSVKITIKEDDATLSIGSGCIYNPGETDYMYVFTAKHCLVGKKGELEASLSKEKIKIQRQEHVNKECYLEIIDYFLHPNDTHDLAIVLVKPIDDVPTVKVSTVENNLIGEFYGFPSPMPEGVGLGFKITDKLLDKQTKMFQIRTEDTLDTYLSGAATNCQGFSGSGVYSIKNGSTELIGIITKIASKDVAFSRLDAESVEKLNEILQYVQLPTIEVETPKPPIQIQLDNYLPRFNSRIARIRSEDFKELINKSMEEVYGALVSMNELELKEFLSKYYHPRAGYEREVIISQGLGELWELLTYINCNAERWKLTNYDISNLEIIYEETKEFVNLIFSLDRFSIPFITLQLGLELASSPYKKIIFENLWIIDNFHNIYDDENICLNCGNGKNYPFDNLLKDFSELNETGLLKGIEPKNNTFEELGNIKILCANCIRKSGMDFLIKNNQLVNIERASQ
ncbi:ABC-three component system protein [Bacillus sp. Cs-700]|uniref:ABC-three component system protein n=1 Tax=Bacillus sp. Cs-700 TaxID=2589818 RepID=UPI00140DB219|nr:ABC-three component system protein [Bacillus sp. Cs-700]